MRRVLIGLLLSLVVFFALPAGVGALLPRAHEVAVHVDLPSPVEEVWADLGDPLQWPLWSASTVRVEQHGQGKDALFMQVREGDTLPLRLVSRRAPERLVMDVVEEDLPFGGRWEITLAPVDGGTRVRLREEAHIDHPYVRFVAWAFVDPYAGVEDFAKDLAAYHGSLRPPVRDTDVSAP